jgi:excisionase family DNA binding protein
MIWNDKTKQWERSNGRRVKGLVPMAYWGQFPERRPSRGIRADKNIPSGKYLTVLEAARYLSISERTLRDMMAKRQISYIQRPGKRGLIRFSMADLDEFMLRNRKDCA